MSNKTSLYGTLPEWIKDAADEAFKSYDLENDEVSWRPRMGANLIRMVAWMHGGEDCGCEDCQHRQNYADMLLSLAQCMLLQLTPEMDLQIPADEAREHRVWDLCPENNQADLINLDDKVFH